MQELNLWAWSDTWNLQWYLQTKETVGTKYKLQGSGVIGNHRSNLVQISWREWTCRELDGRKGGCDGPTMCSYFVYRNMQKRIRTNLSYEQSPSVSASISHWYFQAFSLSLGFLYVFTCTCASKKFVMISSYSSSDCLPACSFSLTTELI